MTTCGHETKQSARTLKVHTTHPCYVLVKLSSPRGVWPHGSGRLAEQSGYAGCASDSSGLEVVFTS